MSYWYWLVEWKTSHGEQCSEEFNTERDADEFIEYNAWEKGEHPIKREVEVER